MQETYLSGWAQVLLFLVGGLLFVGLALFVSRLLRPNKPNPEKNATYESGESPIGSPWIQFNIRFYILALIFILFEVEIVFLFPWATVFADKNLMEQTDGRWGWIAFGEMVLFVGVLALGLAYAWAKGHLDWVKPEPKISDYRSPVPKKLYDQINERYKNG
jgi:NADH-quinone oxidoreductase subunit A